jgi:hypothetical protein
LHQDLLPFGVTAAETVTMLREAFKEEALSHQGFTNGFFGSNVVTCHLKTNCDLGVLQQAEPTKILKKFAMR